MVKSDTLSMELPLPFLRFGQLTFSISPDCVIKCSWLKKKIEEIKNPWNNTKPCWILIKSRLSFAPDQESNDWYTYMLGTGTVSMECFFLCYLVVTLKPKCFNSFYCSTCIPDNQTGSWPWGPWRSCRAVPHTHGCSGGKPHGGIQSWTLCCPGCCCPRWNSPHPSVLNLEGSRLGQGVEEEGVDHAFPILLMKTKLKKLFAQLCLVTVWWDQSQQASFMRRQHTAPVTKAFPALCHSSIGIYSNILHAARAENGTKWSNIVLRIICWKNNKHRI